MTAAVAFLTALAQALSALTLHPEAHRIRERAPDTGSSWTRRWLASACAPWIPAQASLATA